MTSVPILTRIDPFQRKQKHASMASLYPTRKDRLCACGCKQELTGRRRRWASDACSERAWARAGVILGVTEMVRSEVFKRDKGICAACGFDCYSVERAYAFASRKRFRQGGEELWDAVVAKLTRLGFHVFSWSRLTLWDADHIVPVHNGGGGCELGGYQTLCVPCHIAKTAREARGGWDRNL